MGLFGIGAILLALAAVAALNIATSAGDARRAVPAPEPERRRPSKERGRRRRPMSRVAVGVVVVAFVALQATNATVVSILSLYVPRGSAWTLIWAGIALGVAAGWRSARCC